jgi:prepilin-type N-terminal cleavage/methylation domain-containing protein
MNKKGISIIEVLVAMVVLGIALAGILPSFISYSRLNRDADVRAGAATAATQVMDRLRQSTFGSWSTLGNAVSGNTNQRTMSVDTGFRTYGITVTLCSTRCTGTSRDVTVVVSSNGKEYYRVSTVFVAFGTATGS